MVQNYKVGYARVSTKHQNIQLQVDALNEAGCNRIFTDKISSQKAERQGLIEAIECVRKGDTLVVWKLDRLCRSTKELIDISTKLDEKGVSLHSLTEQIDTSSPAGRMYFTVLGAIAQMEREIMKERIMAGMESAKKNGRSAGRKKLDKNKIKSAKTLLEAGATYEEAANSLSIGLSTLYKYIPPSSLLSEDIEATENKEF